jgi:hypothetical protein
MKQPKDSLAKSQRERGVASSAVLGVRVLILITRFIHKLRNLGYMFAFLTYDLLIIGIAFFMRRPRLRKLILKLASKKSNTRQLQSDGANLNLAIEQWVNTVDQLYYVTHSGWLDGRFSKTPNGQKLRHPEPNVSNNQKPHSQIRSANEGLPPALC